jgi:hypothetical protein
VSRLDWHSQQAAWKCQAPRQYDEVRLNGCRGNSTGSSPDVRLRARLFASSAFKEAVFIRRFGQVQRARSNIPAIRPVLGEGNTLAVRRPDWSVSPYLVGDLANLTAGEIKHKDVALVTHFAVGYESHSRSVGRDRWRRIVERTESQLLSHTTCGRELKQVAQRGKD